MAESLKKLFVGGNWKSNNTLADSKNLVENVLNKLDFDPNRVGNQVFHFSSSHHFQMSLLPLFSCTSLMSLKPSIRKFKLLPKTALPPPLVPTLVKLRIILFFSLLNSFLSPAHIQDVKVHWVIIGHSERRSKYNDTDEVWKKMNISRNKNF